MPTVRTTLVRESRCLRRLKFRNVPVKRGICRSQCREGEKRVIKVYISLANSARLFDFPSAWKIRWRRATSAEINDRLRCYVTGIKWLDIFQSCYVRFFTKHEIAEKFDLGRLIFCNIEHTHTPYVYMCIYICLCVCVCAYIRVWLIWLKIKLY